MSIDQKAAMLPPVTNTQHSGGPAPLPEPTDAPSSSTANLMYNSGGSGQQSFDSKDVAETTPQFKPRSHYAQPYYQSTSNNHGPQQQQLPTTSQNPIGQTYARNSLTPERRQSSLTDSLHHQPQHGYNQNSTVAQPPPPPCRMNSNSEQYPGPGNVQNAPSYGAGGNRRSLGQNGGARHSLADRSGNPSHAVYYRNDDGGAGGGNGGTGVGGAAGGGSQRRDSNGRLHRDYRQYDGTGEDDTDPSVLRRNTKYVNRESLYSFQQVVTYNRLIIYWHSELSSERKRIVQLVRKTVIAEVNDCDYVFRCGWTVVRSVNL